MNEEMRRTMQFIVEQQARLTASLQSLEEMNKAHSAQAKKNDEQMARNSEQIGKNSVQIGQLGDLLSRTVRFFDAQGRQTDERLNALINIVERYLSDGPN